MACSWSVVARVLVYLYLENSRCSGQAVVCEGSVIKDVLLMDTK